MRLSNWGRDDGPTRRLPALVHPIFQTLLHLDIGRSCSRRTFASRELPRKLNVPSLYYRDGRPKSSPMLSNFVDLLALRLGRDSALSYKG